MNDRIIVELTKEEAELIADGSGLVGPLQTVAERCRTALHTNHPDGTIAWVTAGSGRVRQLAFLESGKWWKCGSCSDLYPIHKVEPLRILGDDEIAIKRPLSNLSAVWRSNARHARDCDKAHLGAATACDLIADALERTDG